MGAQLNLCLTVVSYTNAAKRAIRMNTANKLLDLATKKLWRFGENNSISMMLADMDYKEIDMGKGLRRGHKGNLHR